MVTMVMTNTTSSLGTTVNVCSCTLVNVCIRLSTTLTTHAATNSGALITIAWINKFRAICAAISGPMRFLYQSI
jgi:hypothetical protein